MVVLKQDKFVPNKKEEEFKREKNVSNIKDI